MTKIGPNWPKNDPKLPKWPKNDPKWPKMAQKLAPPEKNRTDISAAFCISAAAAAFVLNWAALLHCSGLSVITLHKLKPDLVPPPPNSTNCTPHYIR